MAAIEVPDEPKVIAGGLEGFVRRFAFRKQINHAPEIDVDTFLIDVQQQ